MRPSGAATSDGLERDIGNEPLRAAVVFYIDLNVVFVDGNVTADRGDQIVPKRFKFRRCQIRAVVDEDELQALLGAIRTGLPA